MSRYTDRAAEMRSLFKPDGKTVYNCAQTVAAVFASDAGYDEDTALRAATCFRGGMQMGSVCGAVTGGLLALGLAGIEDRDTVDEYLRKVRQAHAGVVDCGAFVSDAQARGIEKKTCCDALIRECVGYVEEILKKNGVI